MDTAPPLSEATATPASYAAAATPVLFPDFQDLTEPTRKRPLRHTTLTGGGPQNTSRNLARRGIQNSLLSPPDPLTSNGWLTISSSSSSLTSTHMDSGHKVEPEHCEEDAETTTPKATSTPGARATREEGSWTIEPTAGSTQQRQLGRQHYQPQPHHSHHYHYHSCHQQYHYHYPRPCLVYPDIPHRLRAISDEMPSLMTMFTFTLERAVSCFVVIITNITN